MADELVRQAVAQAKVGNKTEARKLATRAIKSDPNNVSAWVVMAQVVGDRQKAIDCLETVLQLEPGHPWATLHINRLKYGDASPAAPSKPVSSSLSTGAAHPAGLPPAEPDEDDETDIMRDLRQRAPSSFDMRVEDLGDFVRPIDSQTDVNLSGASLDPLAGTDDWQRPLTDTSRDFTYDEIKDVIGVDTGALRNQQGQPRRRVAPMLLLFIAVFVIMALLAMGIGAWAMGMFN